MNSSFFKLLPENEHAVFQKSLSEYPPRSIRIRPSLSRIPTPMRTYEVPWFPFGRVLDSVDLRRPSQFFEYLTGDYYIQDAGSMLALSLLDAKPGEAICDLCAAPGGKASAILEMLSELDACNTTGGWLLANEPIRARLPILEYTLSRTGYFRFVTSGEDPATIARKFPQVFDAILVDAPCSGQALVANQKRDVNAYDQRQIDHSAARQRRILLEAVKMLKPGGRLVYSTCTFATEENEEQIQFLMDRFPDAWAPLQPVHLSKWASPIQPGCFRVWPHRDPTAGAFAGGLKLIRQIESRELEEVSELGSFKRTDTRSIKGQTIRNNGGKNIKLKDSRSETGAGVIEQFGDFEGLRFRVVADRITALSSDVEINDAMLLTRWPEIAVRTGNRWEPQLSLALASREHFRAIRSIELSDGQVRSFFEGQAILKEQTKQNAQENSRENKSYAMNDDIDKSAWCVALCRGKPIGWMKEAGNRYNNRLPKIAYQQIGNDCT